MRAEPASVRVCRLWVDLYTRGLAADARERRIAELESDLWEQLHDPESTDGPGPVLGRTLRGIHSDVWWRYRTLLDQRGARQRSHPMSSTRTSNWWPPAAAVVGVVFVALGLLGLVVGEAVTGGEGRGLVLAFLPAVGGGLILGGLAARRSRLVLGSRLVVTGAVLGCFGDLLLIPVAAFLILSGIWTGDLVPSGRPDRPDLDVVRRSIAAQWPRWLLAAALFVGLGFLALVVGEQFDSEECTEVNPCWEDTAVWATWILSWLAAMVTGAVGLVLGVLRLTTRHHTRTV